MTRIKEIIKMKDELMNYLEKSKYKNQKRIQRLVEKRNVEIVERKKTEPLAYSYDKGERIGLCIKYKGKYVSDNIIFFVLCHELAHIMTKSIGHTKEFWNNMDFLLNFAELKKLYKPITKSFDYCGLKKIFE